MWLQWPQRNQIILMIVRKRSHCNSKVDLNLSTNRLKQNKIMIMMTNKSRFKKKNINEQIQ